MEFWSLVVRSSEITLNLQDHLAKAQHNWRFLLRLDEVSDSDIDDWRVVIVFYSALHLVDAYLHTRGANHGRSHGERNLVLRSVAERGLISRTAWDAYVRLESRARAVRYTELAASRNELSSLVRVFRELESEVLSVVRSQMEFARLSFER